MHFSDGSLKTEHIKHVVVFVATVVKRIKYMCKSYGSRSSINAISDNNSVQISVNRRVYKWQRVCETILLCAMLTSLENRRHEIRSVRNESACRERLCAAFSPADVLAKACALARTVMGYTSEVNGAGRCYVVYLIT